MSKRYDLSQPWNDESRCYSEALGEESLRFLLRRNNKNRCHSEHKRRVLRYLDKLDMTNN